MTTKILCATDGSAHSDAAVTAAAEMAAKFGAPLSLIAVNIQVPEGRGRGHALWTDQEFDQILSVARQKAKAHAAIDVETVRAVGRNPTDVIVDYADRNGFDHLVVGTPRKGVSRLVLGSVAAAVVAKAHCPVTVAR
jgi:nucleotide-binding universal stress UspA family protein